MNKYLKNIIYIILLIVFPFFIINLKTYNLIYTIPIIFIFFLFFFIKPYKLKNDYNFKIINIEGLLFICFICMIIGSINTPYFNFKVLIFTLPIIFFNILKKIRLSFIFSVLN